jgi:hypothetical protein
MKQTLLKIWTPSWDTVVQDVEVEVKERRIVSISHCESTYGTVRGLLVLVVVEEPIPDQQPLMRSDPAERLPL